MYTALMSLGLIALVVAAGLDFVAKMDQMFAESMPSPSRSGRP